MNAGLRRFITIPAVFAATALVTLAAPVWLPLAWILSRRTRYRGALPAGAFVAGYLWCESIGVLASLVIWIRHGFCRRESSRYRGFLADNFTLQCAWANALKVLGERLFALRFVVTGFEALPGPPVIFVPRHASSGDTVIPIVFYARVYGRGLRYVLKRELLLDPCLDIVGNRLPNYFVDRASEATQAEVQGILHLLDGLGEDGILIYPEGTRFSPGKRARIIQRGGEQAVAARRWSHVLPPRQGGIGALLEHNPGLDLLFCAHAGLEGASNPASLIDGSWLGAEVRIHFWRVPFAAIPGDAPGQRDLLAREWDRMNAEVARRAGAARHGDAAHRSAADESAGGRQAASDRGLSDTRE